MGRKKKNREEYINDFIKIHGTKYSYNEFENNGSTKNSVVICPIHGRFNITPSHHLRGHGCQICGKQKQLLEQTKTTKQFITEARQVHGNKFIYDKTDLKCKDDAGRVIITCRIHGDFKQTPSNHLYGYGCKKCKTDKLSKLFRKSFEEYEKEASILHNDAYEYHQDYINRNTEIYITCKKCGYKFTQTPANHLQGKGCPMCKISHAENDIKKLLDENNIQYVYQKKFDWLGKQSIDFFISDYNIAIECQGMQHFEPKEYFGGEDEFKNILERDERKLKLCNEYNIKLLYYANYGYNFPYKVFTDITTILNEIKKE